MPLVRGSWAAVDGVVAWIGADMANGLEEVGALGSGFDGMRKCFVRGCWMIRASRSSHDSGPRSGSGELGPGKSFQHMGAGHRQLGAGRNSGGSWSLFKRWLGGLVPRNKLR
jgi:hypothetical protein